MTSPAYWRLVETIAKALDEGERDAVLGDLMEAHQTSGSAVWDVCGLVVRREAALWLNWVPWVFLATVVMPLAFLISASSRLISQETAVYVWMYANNFEWGLLQYRGFWYVLPGAVGLVLLRYLTLGCWSWSIGYLLGSASHKGLRGCALLFGLISLVGEIVVAPRYLAFSLERFRFFLPAQNDPLSALTFYRLVFPLAIQVMLVIVPSIWGLRESARAQALPVMIRRMAWILAITTLLVIVVYEPGLGALVATYTRLWLWHSWGFQVLPCIAYWPLGYLIGTAIFRRPNTLHKQYGGKFQRRER